MSDTGDTDAETMGTLYAELTEVERSFQSTKNLLSALYDRRRDAVSALTKAGVPYSVIADRIGVSKSMVQKMLTGSGHEW